MLRPGPLQSYSQPIDSSPAEWECDITSCQWGGTRLRCASSLLGFFQDGAHSRDDSGLGAAGGGGDGDDPGQRGGGGQQSRLRQSDWNRRVPLTLPLLSI